MTTLLYSGNFGLGHDLDTILRAAATLNGPTNLRIRLVGGGKGLASVRRLVRELRLKDTEFLPSVPLYELASLLAAGDIHLVTQRPRTEGLIVPSKIYGTLAVGRPVIFIGPGRCEVAHIVRESGCSFVVVPGDVGDAAGALGTLALDGTLRDMMGERARRYYQKHFGRGRSVARIIDLIERVAGSNCTV